MRKSAKQGETDMASTISEQIRKAATGPLPEPVDDFGSATLSAWVSEGAFHKASSFLDRKANDAYLSDLPDDEARRTFLLLVAEALA
jgi:hypothetical protein